jgi:hypothetical protein
MPSSFEVKRGVTVNFNGPGGEHRSSIEHHSENDLVVDATADAGADAAPVTGIRAER